MSALRARPHRATGRCSRPEPIYLRAAGGSGPRHPTSILRSRSHAFAAFVFSNLRLCRELCHLVVRHRLGEPVQISSNSELRASADVPRRFPPVFDASTAAVRVRNRSGCRRVATLTENRIETSMMRTLMTCRRRWPRQPSWRGLERQPDTPQISRDGGRPCSVLINKEL